MWNVFDEVKPKKDGWYTCTVEVKNQQRYVMSLYWYGGRQKFIDNIRQNVCEVYDVRSRFGGERLYDIGQDRTEDVIAWQEIPEPYMEGFIYYTELSRR